MSVSDEDRAKMQRLAQDLDAWINYDRGTPEQRASLLALINRLRDRRGLRPLRDEPVPEEGFYERARALGMDRVDPRHPESLSLRWTIAGAVAADVYRDEPRLTTDLDVLTEWSHDLPRALESAGYVVETLAAPDEIPHLIRARRGAERVDLLLPVVAYQREALARSRDGVLTAEDVIVHKLIAWRARDRDDIASILRAGHHLDEGYIEHWAHEWEVTDRWRYARGDR